MRKSMAWPAAACAHRPPSTTVSIWHRSMKGRLPAKTRRLRVSAEHVIPMAQHGTQGDKLAQRWHCSINFRIPREERHRDPQQPHGRDQDQPWLAAERLDKEAGCEREHYHLLPAQPESFISTSGLNPRKTKAPDFLLGCF